MEAYISYFYWTIGIGIGYLAIGIGMLWLSKEWVTLQVIGVLIRITPRKILAGKSEIETDPWLAVLNVLFWPLACLVGLIDIIPDLIDLMATIAGGIVEIVIIRPLAWTFNQVTMKRSKNN